MKSISYICKIHCNSFVLIMPVTDQIFSEMNRGDIGLLYYRAVISFISPLEAISFVYDVIFLTFNF